MKDIKYCVLHEIQEVQKSCWGSTVSHLVVVVLQVYS